jgi:hypothetical protein
MNTGKLKEALVELQQQRSILDGAISNIQRIIAMMNGGSETVSVAEPETRKTSYIDDTVKILEVSGEPLHVREIAKQIAEMRGSNSVSRASVESSLTRHIQGKGRARVAKVKPGYFGLSSWKSIIHDPKSDNAA